MAINKTAQAERSKRYRERKKIAKYGIEAAGVNMSGKHGNQARGEKNGRWNSSRIISSHGYVKVRVGRDHPLADPNGYAYEHLIVWCAAGNSKPKTDEVIHHRNENKQDNRLHNLELKKRSVHAVEHTKECERDALGRFKNKVSTNSPVI